MICRENNQEKLKPLSRNKFHLYNTYMVYKYAGPRLHNPLKHTFWAPLILTFLSVFK